MLLFKFKISGHSMSPTLKHGDIVLASSIPYFFINPKIKDIVVFKKNGKIFIKRIKRKEKEKYYVLGDNKKDSTDSRNFGLISITQIVGKVIYKL